MCAEPYTVTVVFASNARGMLPLSVAAWSVAEQARASTLCDICILSDAIPEAQQESLRALIRRAGERHRVRFIEIDRMLPEGLNVVGERWPRVAWARVFLPDLLPEVRRAVYLDIDTLACTDLRMLAETDMHGAALGVVLEHVSHKGSHFNERLDIPQSCLGYFNSGVLLMDLDVFRAEGLGQRVVDFAQAHRDVLTCPDQDALNGALCDRLTTVTRYRLFGLVPIRTVTRRGNKPFEKDAWEFGDAARLHRLARGASPFALRLRYLLACITGAARPHRHALKNALRDLHAAAPLNQRRSHEQIDFFLSNRENQK